MTYLAQDQPFLPHEENLLNRSLFIRLAKWLVTTLNDIQAVVTDSPPPGWLLALVRRWEKKKTTVATFNYDTLVERAYLATTHEDAEAGDKDRQYKGHRSIYAVPIQPARTRRGFSWDEGGGDAFGYLKMHGSINWFYSGAPSFYGEPVYDFNEFRWGAEGGEPQKRADWVSREVRIFLPDKVPLVVPPTTDKSAWFNNELIRGQWLILGDSLRRSERLISIGYSLPPTDSLVHSLLATSCVGHEVVLVNPSAETLPRYTELLPGAKINSDFVGVSNAVELFASDYVK